METESNSRGVKRKHGHFGMHCIAPGCTNYFYNKKKGFHYHSYPVGNKTLLRKWLQNLTRADPPVHPPTTMNDTIAWFDGSAKFSTTRISEILDKTDSDARHQSSSDTQYCFCLKVRDHCIGVSLIAALFTGISLHAYKVL